MTDGLCPHPNPLPEGEGACSPVIPAEAGIQSGRILRQLPSPRKSGLGQVFNDGEKAAPGLGLNTSEARIILSMPGPAPNRSPETYDREGLTDMPSFTETITGEWS